MIANLTQVKMEKFAGHSIGVSQPFIRIGPEPFDPVNMVASLGSAFLFSDDHMAATQPQCRIGLPLIRVVQRTSNVCSWICLITSARLSAAMGAALTVPLPWIAKHNHFAGRAPAAFAPPMPTECGFVAFDGTGKHFTRLLFVSAAGTDETEKSFLGRTTNIVTKSLTINRNVKSKKSMRRRLVASERRLESQTEIQL